MNKEQLLGRLLMNGHINMDEFYLLSAKDKMDSKTLTFLTNEPNVYIVTKKKEQETMGMFDWLEEFRKNNNVIDPLFRPKK